MISGEKTYGVVNRSTLFHSTKEYSRMTGAVLNAKMVGIRLYKVLHNDLKHYDYTYEPNALNSLDKLGEKFDSDPDCKPGGLYFCAESELLRWIESTARQITTCLIAPVIVPADAQISIGEHKFKTNKLFLGQPISVAEFYSDTYLRTMPLDYLWVGCWTNRLNNDLAKRAYLLGPDRFDFKSKANLLYLVGVYHDIEFLDSIKADVQNMLEDPAFRSYVARTIGVISVKAREWFDSNFPQHADLITALGLKAPPIYLI